jgi:hypothetical protein
VEGAGVKKRLIVAVALVTVLAGLLATPAGANGVIRLDFEKELVAPGIWSGTVEQTGGIRTFLDATDFQETGNVWHLTFDWFVSDPDFQAEVTGVLNLGTGRVSLNGMVVDGAYQGSNIHVDARLDLADLSSNGTMTITP